MAVSYYRYLELSGSVLLLEDGTPLLLEDLSGALLLDAWKYGVTFRMTKLFDLTYRVARELGYVEESVATGGTVGTIIDSMRTEDADYWNGGTAWILRDALGSGSAPEDEYAIISDFSSPTVTLSSNLTTAVAIGDRYAIATSHVPLGIIISKINQALMDIGIVPYVDTSLVTESDQTEYELPIGAGMDLREVWLQLINNNADNNRWMLVHGWKIENGVIGYKDTLIMPTEYDSGYKIKLVYMGAHPELYVSTDTLSDAIPIERIVYPAIRDCFIWLKQNTRRPEFDENIAYWTQRASEAKASRQVLAPKRGAISNIKVV